MEYSASRKTAWDILSDLYLDNECVPHYFATRLAALPFSLDELEIILFTEIHPVFFGNLTTVTGEWIGWDEVLVEQLVSKYLADMAAGTHEFSAAPQSGGFIKRWQWAVKRAERNRSLAHVETLIRPDWVEVAKHIKELRQSEG